MEILRIAPKVHTDIERKRYLQELFADRYGEFMRWALQIARPDRLAAAELVHDTYVNFSRTLPDLAAVENLDGYIYDSLRNLNTSRQRRAWKHTHESLDLLEFDSLRVRLRTHGSVSNLLEVQDQLESLCAYLCWRKQSVRSASLLILRFFRNYYPDQIARIARLSRNAISAHILRARNDARHHFENCSKWDAVSDGGVKIPLSRGSDRVEVNTLTRRLNDMIRLNRNGECLSEEQLVALYGPASTSAPDTEQLSHLVSCDECLSKVAARLGDGSSKDRLPMTFDNPTNGTPWRLMANAEEEIRDLLFHDPSALVLAVNGDDLLECSVTPLALEQVMVVPSSAPLKFVEVFNRVGQRLLKMDIVSAPPDGPAETHCQVLLAGDRILTVAIQWYGSEPSIRLEYTAASTHERGDAAALELVSTAPIGAIDTCNVDGRTRTNRRHSGGWWKMVYRRLKWWNIAPVLAIISGIFLWTHNRAGQLAPGPQADGPAILAQAQRAEASLTQMGSVSHQSVSFEEDSENSAAIRTGRIEVWRGGDRIAKRFYDGQSKLVAGQWKHGSDTSVLKDGKLEPRAPGEPCADESSVWSCDLSAQGFAWLGKNGDIWRAESLQDEYVVHLVRDVSSNANSFAPRLIRADLYINRKTMRSRQETLWVESGGRVHTYRLSETAYEPRTDLKPDSPILRPDTDLKQRTRDRSTSVRVPQDPLIQAELVHLQLEVLARLHTAHEDVGKPIAVERTNNQSILVQGVLGTDTEAKQLRSLLADLTPNPMLNIRIRSVSELRDENSKPAKPIRIEQYEVDATHCPAEDMLRAHFQALGYRDQRLDDQIRQYTQLVLGQSAKALQEAWALHQFSTSFRSQDVAALSPEDERTWARLLEEHTQSLTESLETLRRSVSWVPRTERDPEDILAPPTTRTQPLTSTVENILTQTTEINHHLNSMLTAAADSNETARPSDVNLLISVAQTDLLKVQTASRQYSASLRLRNQ